MLTTILTILFVVVCIVLCVSILLQAAKGGGLGAGLGGGTATTQVFGGRGAGGFLSRVTVVFAVLFMGLSLGLAYLSSQPQSVFSSFEEEELDRLDEDEVIEEGTLEVSPDGTPIDGADPAVPTDAAAEDPAPTPADAESVPNPEVGGAIVGGSEEDFEEVDEDTAEPTTNDDPVENPVVEPPDDAPDAEPEAGATAPE